MTAEELKTLGDMLTEFAAEIDPEIKAEIVALLVQIKEKDLSLAETENALAAAETRRASKNAELAERIADEKRLAKQLSDKKEAAARALEEMLIRVNPAAQFSSMNRL